jgi:SAM-dependent methyltransferase
MVQVGYRRQTNPENRGVVDRDPADLNRSLAHRGYAHHSGTEFTEERVGPFGEWIRKLVEDARVVELGCGSGVLSRYCAFYVGLDGNPEAGNCCGLEFYPVDLTEPYGFDPPVQADFLLSFNFLEHVEEHLIPVLLAQADQLLRPGAQIFMVADRSHQETGEHVTCRDEAWWHEQFQAAGWIQDVVTEEFRQSYFDNAPLHWREWGISGTQQLFRYRKES